MCNCEKGEKNIAKLKPVHRAQAHLGTHTCTLGAKKESKARSSRGPSHHKGNNRSCRIVAHQEQTSQSPQSSVMCNLSSAQPSWPLGVWQDVGLHVAVVFSCLATRTVRLELVCSMCTLSFSASLHPVASVTPLCLTQLESHTRIFSFYFGSGQHLGWFLTSGTLWSGCQGRIFDCRGSSHDICQKGQSCSQTSKRIKYKLHFVPIKVFISVLSFLWPFISNSRMDCGHVNSFTCCVVQPEGSITHCWLNTLE